MHEYRNYDHLGKKCSTNADCKNGAKCLFNVCACPPHTIANLSEHCVPEQNRPSLLQRIYNIPSINKIDTSFGQFPGNTCGEDKLCKLGSICKPILSATPHCVCDTRLVVNSTGHCTTKLLSNTKKSKQFLLFCKNLITELPGSHCSKLDHECVNGSVCSGGYCICENNTQNIGLGQCVPINNQKASYKHRNVENMNTTSNQSQCLSSEECKKPALCLEKKCRCPEGTTESSNGNCIYQKSFGKKWTSIKLIFCCLVKPGAYCDEIQLGIMCPKYASCLRNVCVCNYGIQLDGSKCNPIKFYQVDPMFYFRR